MARLPLPRVTLALAVGAACGLAAVAGAGGNLVVNGTFESGLVGFSSDYVHTPQGNVDEGTWWVHPPDPGGPWFGTQHTPGGAAAMSVNGDDSSQAGQKRVWYQTVAVKPGKTYRFSTWALATAAGFSGYSLRFAFDGVVVGGTIVPTQAFTWEEFTTTIVPSGRTVEISIKNVSGITFPNDFMLDDISLELVVAASDLNGDGTVDAADLGILLGAWGTCGACGNCPADLDGDCAVGPSDLGILLGDWTG
ncbi:MAG: hypothetical protein JNM94_15045 [Phycisphaerae bacterium]|nr:hypothetical protein [Phycisphaerae bacterium]